MTLDDLFEEVQEAKHQMNRHYLRCMKDPRYVNKCIGLYGGTQERETELRRRFHRAAELLARALGETVI